MLQEGRVDKVTFIGVGLQVNKAVAAVELVKKKITECISVRRMRGADEERESDSDSNRFGDEERGFGCESARLSVA